MTRKRKPLTARVMVTRYGDEGPWTVYLGPHSPFVWDPSEAPPPTLADLYVATATGTPPDLRVTVTEIETGAAVTLPTGMAETDAARLWRDAQEIVGIAERQSERGRPTERLDRLADYRAAIEALRDAGWQETRIYARVVLQRLGRIGDDSQLGDDVRDAGGWRAFRRSVYRGE